MHQGWYNSYKPLIFGGKIWVPTDPGIMYLGFSEKPFEYDPSGFFDASRSRELDIIVGLVGTIQQSQLICEAIAYNFLWMSNGNAVIRYH